MKAREIRIGNFLQGKDNSVRTVFAIDINSFTDKEGLSSLHRDAQPIPLTQGWVTGFGFTKNKHGQWSIGSPDWHLELAYIGGIWYPYITEEGELSFEQSQTVALHYIDYVHELQNLYFTLFHKELTNDETNN